MVLFLLLVALLSPTGEAGKIIGGHEAKPHSRPYMAFLRVKISGKLYRCGGFLVREDFVLTAAHCLKRDSQTRAGLNTFRGLQELPPCPGCQGADSSIKVILGAHNIMDQERTQQVIPVRRAILHPKYNYQARDNDIMLLQVWRLQDSRGVAFCPRAVKKATPRLSCSLCGPSLDKLQEVELEVQKAKKCTSLYPNYSTTTQICAGDPRESKSSFKGDSGGPLVCNGVAQGIASYGQKGGTPPRVLTRISSFLPWIQKAMKEYELQGPD